MESSGSQVVIIYLPSFNDEDKLREAIASQINSGISQHAIVVKTKGHGITAYVELPQTRAQQLCAKKKITILNMSGTVKRFFCSHQIFINKLPQTIDSNDVKEYFSQFGTVLHVEIVNTKHSYQADKTVDMRHCYIQFKEKDSASKIIYHPKRHYIKNQEIKIHKTYDIGEGEQTDKKLFLKVEPKCENTEQMENQLHNLFKQCGQLRQKIRLEESKSCHSGSLIFVSVEDGEKAYHKLKETNIGKYKITLKPHSSELGLFVSGIRKNVTNEQIKKAFGIYGKIFDCQLTSRNNPMNQNAIIYYSSEDDAKRAIAEYASSKEILNLFNNKPYINYNLSAKDRRDCSNLQRKAKIPPNMHSRAPQFRPGFEYMNPSTFNSGPMMPNKFNHYPPNYDPNTNPNMKRNFNPELNPQMQMNPQMGNFRPQPKEN